MKPHPILLLIVALFLFPMCHIKQSSAGESGISEPPTVTVSNHPYAGLIGPLFADETGTDTHR